MLKTYPRIGADRDLLWIWNNFIWIPSIHWLLVMLWCVIDIRHHYLTHWGRVTHICVGNLTIIGSDNGLSPGRHQAIIWTNAGILLIGPLGTNFNEMLIEILTFSFMKMRLKVSSAKRRPFCLGLNELKEWLHVIFPSVGLLPLEQLVTVCWKSNHSGVVYTQENV